MKRYGYHRTSTREQHLDRGIAEITAYCESNNLSLEKIYTDQQTGANGVITVDPALCHLMTLQRSMKLSGRARLQLKQTAQADCSDNHPGI